MAFLVSCMTVFVSPFHKLIFMQLSPSLTTTKVTTIQLTEGQQNLVVCYSLPFFHNYHKNIRLFFSLLDSHYSNNTNRYKTAKTSGADDDQA